MKKRLECSICLLYIVEIICCYVPSSVVREYWEYQKSLVYHGVCMHISSIDTNIFGIAARFGDPLAYLVICSAVCASIVYLLFSLGNNSRICKNSWIFSIAHTAAVGAFFYYTCEKAIVDEISYRFQYTTGWVSYIIIAINAIALVLALIAQFGKDCSIQSSTIEDKSTSSKTETIDDLKIYKELLDSGVISQDEYEIKKKQIMKL